MFRTGASNSLRTNGCRRLPRFIAGVGVRNALGSIAVAFLAVIPYPMKWTQRLGPEDGLLAENRYCAHKVTGLI
jgi:hypothetical protein